MKPKRNLWIYLFLLMGFILIVANSCKKDDNTPQTGDTATVTDWDKNVYHTVVIGKQTWMVENLRTTHYNDGGNIENIGDNKAWENNTTGAYCWYNNDGAATIGSQYGTLYNWYAVNTGKLCPKGWHVPTDAEWDTLSNFLGGTAIAGGKLKEAGTTHWTTPNTGADNSSGFTALPGGYRNFNGSFNSIGSHSYWWSSTGYDTNNAWYHYVICQGSNFIRWNITKVTGFSVRCIKGEPPA